MPSASFTLDRLESRAGQVVVTGRWSGVRGMRFVRPTLLVDGRSVLADLAHKPWVPVEDAPWTAAFPWEGPAPHPNQAALAVAPSITVPLDSAIAAPPVRRAPEPPPRRAVPESLRPARPAPADPMPAPAPPTVDPARLDEARRRATDAETERDAALRDRTELAAALHHVEAERDDLRDRVGRLERRAADAEDARDELLARDEALRRQRDDALVALQTLQAVRPAVTDEEPLGVRAMPAVPDAVVVRPRPRVSGEFDLWLLRVLGVAAAGCFLLLLASLLAVVL